MLRAHVSVVGIMHVTTTWDLGAQDGEYKLLLDMSIRM